MADESESYKVQPLITNLLRGVLSIEIIACVIASVMTLLPNFRFLPAANFIYWSAIHSLRFLPSLTTVVMLVWIFSANKNARALSPKALDDSPNWAVGWFFIPVMALFKPRTIMLQIYQSSRHPLDWHEDGGAAIVTGWWLIRLLADLIGLTTLKTRFGSEDIVTNGVILFCVLTVIHQIVLLIIATRVNRWQMTSLRTDSVF